MFYLVFAASSLQQQRHDHQFGSLHESPQEEYDEEDAGGGGNEKVEDAEKAETNRVAKGLMDNTALEPSPPPMAAAAESDGAGAAIEQDPPEGPGGELEKDRLLDGGSTLGGMISPRPGQGDIIDDQNTNEVIS